MDYKDFVAILGESMDTRKGPPIQQTEQFCFGIAQGIFATIEKYLKVQQTEARQVSLLSDKEAIYRFGLQIKGQSPADFASRNSVSLLEAQSRVKQMEEAVIVQESLNDLARSG